MAKIDVLDILRMKKQSPLEFEFDNLWIPPMSFYLSMEDIDRLRKIATSIKLASKIELKYKMIDDIMVPRGFKRFSAGTNRVVYKHLEDTRFVAKIAVDRVGMQDNPMEFKNQFYLKPYCTKMFCISPCGTVGFAERVLPIKNKEEFKEIAGDIFDILVYKILGKYVVEDIGTKYFMNYGVRAGFAPVLLDYPYVYKLDGKKLYCTKINPETNQCCDGEIDYDVGFNHLVCTRCKKIYLATDLRDDSIDNKIIIKGGSQMKIVLKKGDQVVGTSIVEEETMKKPKEKNISKELVVRVSGAHEQKQSDSTNKPRNREEDSKRTRILSTLVVSTNLDKKVDNSEKESKGIIESLPFNEEEFKENANNLKIAQEAYENIMKNPDKFIDEYVNKNKDESVANVIENQDEEKTSKLECLPTDHEEEALSEPSNEEYTNEDDSFDNDSSSNDDLERFGIYEDNNEPTFKPIKTKKQIERDANGRFVSTKSKKSGNKTKSNFIPSK